MAQHLVPVGVDDDDFAGGKFYLLGGQRGSKAGVSHWQGSFLLEVRGSGASTPFCPAILAEREPKSRFLGEQRFEQRPQNAEKRYQKLLCFQCSKRDRENAKACIYSRTLTWEAGILPLNYSRLPLLSTTYGSYEKSTQHLNSITVYSALRTHRETSQQLHCMPMRLLLV